MENSRIPSIILVHCGARRKTPCHGRFLRYSIVSQLSSYDFAADLWMKCQLLVPLYRLRLVKLPGNKVMIIGGQRKFTLKCIELYTTVTGLDTVFFRLVVQGFWEWVVSLVCTSQPLHSNLKCLALCGIL